jgi:hypothetical protein
MRLPEGFGRLSSTHSMSLLDLVNHLLNFLAPALVVGWVCALAGGVFGRKAGTPAWWIQAAVNSGAGALALLGGLIFAGRDGTMGAYAALVLACGISQWLVSRGWRG